jgi:hypothetical protein
LSVPSVGASLDGLTNSYSGTAGNGIYIWGAQLNIGSTAKPYFPTTDRLNVPRLTYQNGGGGCPSLLLEKQSTNLVTYSEQFDNADWVKNSTSVTANTATSPDGTQNADTINSISPGPNMKSPNATFTSTTNVSMFVKYVSQQWVMLMSGGAVNDYANFDIQNGVIGSVGSTASKAQIQNFGNGWYRISVTFSGYSGNTNLYFGFIASGTSGWNTFDPNFNKSLYVWGCQIENSTYPTSYIPTTSASATRVPDVCNKYSISSLIGQTEGTIFAQVSFPNLGGLGGSSYVYITDGSFTNSVVIGREPSTPLSRYFFYINAGGTNILNNQANNLQSGFAKMAVAYKSGNWAAYLNGTLVASGTSTFTFSANMTRFGIGTNDGAITIMGDSMIASQAILFPTRLTNAELASLTTI